MDDKGLKYKKSEFLERKYLRKIKICDIKLKNYDEENEIIKCEHHSISNLLHRMTDKEKDINKKKDAINKKILKYENILKSIQTN